MEDNSIVSRFGVSNPKYSAGLGYVIIPSNVDRAAYIQKCLRTGLIGIVTESGGIIWNVQCNKSDLNNIEFPEVASVNDRNSLGSAIVWLNIPKQDNPVVVAVVDRFDQGNDLVEHQFKWFRTFGSGHVEISGRGDTGELDILAIQEKAGSKINITSTSVANDAEVNIFAKGKVSVDAVGDVSISATKSIAMLVQDLSIDDKVTELKYVKGTGLTYVDEFENSIKIDKDVTQIKATKSVMLGEGKESMVLGETLESFLSDLCDQIKSITVPTAFGPSGTPINATAISQLVQQSLEKIKSTYSKTD